jgi:hypothetical protein
LEAVFAAGGIWCEFLRQGPGYIGTEVKCESQVERRYRVQDFWSWHPDFERFREKFAAEYERFDQLIEGLFERQQFVGAYYEKQAGDEDELVPG